MEVGREKFVEETWKVTNEHHDIIVKQLKRLGSSCDWDRERFTLDEGLSRAVREVFVSLYEKGLIYRGYYLVNWCPSCRTAISDDEVEHVETKGKMYHYRYPLADGSGSVAIATTRPETMLGDTAVAVHPEDERYSGPRRQDALPAADGARDPDHRGCVDRQGVRHRGCEGHPGARPGGQRDRATATRCQRSTSSRRTGS